MASPVRVGHVGESASFGVVGLCGLWICELGACAHTCMPGLIGGQGRRRSSPPCRLLWVATTLVLKFAGSLGVAGYRRPPSPPGDRCRRWFSNSQGRSVGRAIAAHLRPKTDPELGLTSPKQMAAHPLESPPNLHHPPQTLLESPSSLHHLPSDPQKTKQFRRNAQLVPAKPRTHPSQMP